MKNTNQNALFVKEFVANIASIDSECFRIGITALIDLFEILGNSRFFKEAIPLIIKYSDFVEHSLVIQLIHQLSKIKFNFDNEAYLQAYIDTMFNYLNTHEFLIVRAAEPEIKRVLHKHYNQRVIENLILNCYCSYYVKTKKAGLRFLKVFENMILGLNPNFYFEMYEKYFESENIEIQKIAFKSFVEYLRTHSIDNKKDFVRKWANILFYKEEGFIKMYWIDFALKLDDKSTVDKNLAQFIYSKSFYIKKHIIDHINNILALTENKQVFLDFFSDLLYSKDKEQVELAIENIPAMVKSMPGKNELKIIFNNLRNFIQTCEDDQINYSVIYYLLKCSRYLSKSDCIDFLLKSLMNYLQSDTESIDENFLDQIKEFVMVVSYSTVKESLEQFFGSLLIKPSQNVN